MSLKVFIGWDPREAAAWQVAARSLLEHATIAVEPVPLLEPVLRARGLYTRAMQRRDGVLWDAISGAPMSTEFALTRFLVPWLAGHTGWAVFCDADFMFRADIAELLALRDEKKAVQVAMHQHTPAEQVKMDAQPQSVYHRKNWSSLMLLNCGHWAQRNLTLEDVNTVPGLKLHSFWWLADIHVGELPIAWNWLEGVSDPAIEPKAVHYTRGTPDLPGYESSAYADEWRATLTRVQRVLPDNEAEGTPCAQASLTG